MTRSDTSVSEGTSGLRPIGNVAEGYAHYQKVAAPGPDLRLPDAYLKWYEIRPNDITIAPAYVQECCDLLRAEAGAGRLDTTQQLGFVLLHHCRVVDFLIVSTWRNENELWESVYVNDLRQEGGFVRSTGDGHRPTFCVWELGVVCHEAQAWARYLSSNREEQAKAAYIADRFTGLV